MMSVLLEYVDLLATLCLMLLGTYYAQTLLIWQKQVSEKDKL